MISLSHIYKTYGSFTAVRDLSLNIKNELFVFLGPNGAGKTTTIKMMTGQLSPTSGSVIINNIDMRRDPVRCKQSFGLVPEQPYLYEKLTASEFVSFMATVYKVPESQAENRMKQLFDIFEVTDKAKELIENLSHGMKQKIALIGAMIHDPKVLFLDEPTTGLDPKATRNLKDLLRGLVDKGSTVFMSTHILEVAERMCDRLGIIYKGQLIVEGTMDYLKSYYNQTGTLEEIFLKLTEDSAQDKVSNYLKELDSNADTHS
jgi:ABC-2 type transport system ATP-binding protein